MNILLQDSRTGLYLRQQGGWTQKPGGARAFRTRFRAAAYKVWHRLPRTCKVTSPAPATARKPRADRRFRFSASSTLVEAKIELSPGNALFIRGEGEGLAWHQGAPLVRVGPGDWVWYSLRPHGRVIFQLLLNDLVWAKGEDLMVQPGHRIEVVPDFEWPEIPRVA